MSDIEIQGAVAAWASFVVTAVGLGGLITQASAISDQMDPFHANRSHEYLGVWYTRQHHFPWWRIAKPAPTGPRITARTSSGFCGSQTVYVMRIPPAKRTGRAGWAIVLAMFFTERPLAPIPGPLASAGDGGDAEEKGEVRSIMGEAVEESKGVVEDGWGRLEQVALVRHRASACVSVSRATLMVMLIVSNARPVFEFNEATGYRAGFASYIGQWYVTWPIGEEAVVRFARHDSLGSSEVLPRYFRQRVDRACEVACGIVSSESAGLKVAFCGRKVAGRYRLELGRKGFQGAHGSRHLYNMIGGKAYEFDYMFARAEEPTTGEEEDDVQLTLPSRDKDGRSVVLRVPRGGEEEEVLKRALDCLPWTSLSWSIHRGMRDILTAYGRPLMDARRRELADVVLRTVEDPDMARRLQAKGWDAGFVRDYMGNMAATAVLAGGGNSGDSVRAVTDIVSVVVGDRELPRLDNVSFWRRSDEGRDGSPLDADGIVALTKLFVLEWSNELDYQMYHRLPINLLFG